VTGVQTCALPISEYTFSTALNAYLLSGTYLRISFIFQYTAGKYIGHILQVMTNN